MKSIEIILNLVKEGHIEIDKAIVLIEELCDKQNITWVYPNYPNNLPNTSPYNPEPFSDPYNPYKIWCNNYCTSKTNEQC